MSTILLHIETSTQVCSIALSENDKCIALKEDSQKNMHAASITLFIQDALNQTNISLKNVDAICVSQGPGSYTGLRIGVSTAKGICFALDKPLIGVNSLLAMTNGFLKEYGNKIKENTFLIPMIDARRMEVFCSVYSREMELIESAGPKIIDETSFQELVKKHSLCFFGDGAEKCEPLFQANLSVQIIKHFYPSAKYLIEPALQAYKENKFENLAYFEPSYLKEFYFS